MVRSIFKFIFLMIVFCLNSYVVVFATSVDKIKDPTKPFLVIKQLSNSKQNTKNRPVTLNAIFINKNSRRAIINDQLYVKGDVIYGKTIINIALNYVELKGKNGTDFLYLLNSIKTTTD